MSPPVGMRSMHFDIVPGDLICLPLHAHPCNALRSSRVGFHASGAKRPRHNDSEQSKQLFVRDNHAHRETSASPLVFPAGSSASTLTADTLGIAEGLSGSQSRKVIPFRTPQRNPFVHFLPRSTGCGATRKGDSKFSLARRLSRG